MGLDASTELILSSRAIAHAPGQNDDRCVWIACANLWHQVANGLAANVPVKHEAIEGRLLQGLGGGVYAEVSHCLETLRSKVLHQGFGQVSIIIKHGDSSARDEVLVGQAKYAICGTAP